MSSFFDEYCTHFSLENFIKDALKEDVGNGDFTSLSTIPKSQLCKMHLLAKETGIIAGVEATERIMNMIYPEVKLNILINDGASIKKGDIVFYIEGNAQRLLTYERFILNIMQRMSGIATKTKYLQSLCVGTKAKVTDTRKTTPLFRFFEKWAVHIGCGANHRWGLYDMILIKDNHIDAAGSITNAVKSTKNFLQQNNLNLKIEVETRNIEEVKEALSANIHRIMLDNFDIETTKKAVNLINGQTEIESSGGINEHTIAKYANCGVDYISVGALTHHINSLDLSLKVIK